MKYVIEIDNEFKDFHGNKLYKAKGFNSLVFDQNGLDKLEKYEAFQTYNKGYQQGYEDAMKKFDPLYFEPGDVVKDKDGNKYAFVKGSDTYFNFVTMNSGVFHGTISSVNTMAGQKITFTRTSLIENGFTKTGEKVALVYYRDYCCCDKQED